MTYIDFKHSVAKLFRIFDAKSEIKYQKEPMKKLPCSCTLNGGIWEQSKVDKYSNFPWVKHGHFKGVPAVTSFARQLDRTKSSLSTSLFHSASWNLLGENITGRKVPWGESDGGEFCRMANVCLHEGSLVIIAKLNYPVQQEIIKCKESFSEINIDSIYGGIDMDRFCKCTSQLRGYHPSLVYVQVIREDHPLLHPNSVFHPGSTVKCHRFFFFLSSCLILFSSEGFYGALDKPQYKVY